ncbi:hypothetical protein AB3S75_047551 [Citrus x aurantiifolia]
MPIHTKTLLTQRRKAEWKGAYSPQHYLQISISGSDSSTSSTLGSLPKSLFRAITLFVPRICMLDSLSRGGGTARPGAQGFNHAPDLRDSILHAIHTRFGENLNNLLLKVGVPAPDNWTPTELAAQVIDAEGNALYAFEASLREFVNPSGKAVELSRAGEGDAFLEGANPKFHFEFRTSTSCCSWCFTISIGNERRSGGTCGTTYWITPVRHEAADAESAPMPLAMPCLVPRHGGGSVARHKHRAKGRLSNSSEPPYLTTT